MDHNLEKVLKNGKKQEFIKFTSLMNVIDDKGQFPLKYSVVNSNYDTFKELIPYTNVNLADNYGVNALITIISNIKNDKNQIDKIKLLLQYGADVNSKTIAGITPLMTAVFIGKIDIINILINSGANINDIGNDGKSALFLAVIANNKAIVECLLKYNANTNLIDKDNKSILNYSRNKDITKLLVDAGAK